MIRILGLAVAVSALFVAGIGVADAAGPVTVQLTPQNNSGESGTAILTEVGAKTKVVVAINGAPAGVAQPLHVHKGTCGNINPAPAFGLTTLANGKSETTIDIPLTQLQQGGYAINGHKSAQEAQTYVFCGNIPTM
jgi:hypothetical protein